MKTHAIVQGFAICLLLVWTSVWDVPLSDAGNPPVRLAVDRGDTPTEDQLPAPNTLPQNPAERVYTQTIPTEIRDNSIRLIPTAIDSEVVVTTALDPAIAETGVLITGRGQIASGGIAISDIFEQPGHPKFYVLGMIPEPGDLKSFLDMHVSRGPFRHVETEFVPKSSTRGAPWYVGEQPCELIDCYEPPTPNGMRLNFYQPIGLSYFDGVRLPWKHWWQLELAPGKSQFAPRPIVSVAKQRPGRFNTIELDRICQILFQYPEYEIQRKTASGPTLLYSDSP
ncbi:MAG: hypothetical protein JWN70_4120 [Planctomycetaceae bacterium]|nr:hypothetical protein [Planctomycetaceae bacterium]